MSKFNKLFCIVFLAMFSLFNITIAHAAPTTDPALARATFSNDELLMWANQAAVAVNTYNYANYQQQFQSISQQYFTPDSWITYLNSLQNSGNIRTIVVKQMSLSATINGPSSISQQGVIQGRYTWKVQVPILITYENASGSKNQQSFTVTMDIERTSSTPQGVSIKQFMMSK